MTFRALELSVYEIYPHHLPANFHRVTKMKILDIDLTVCIATQDMIGLLHISYLTLWNFVLDTMRTFDVGYVYHDESLYNIF
jgi:hypothetical protein